MSASYVSIIQSALAIGHVACSSDLPNSSASVGEDDEHAASRITLTEELIETRTASTKMPP
jgi:hypothetical protein